MDTRRHRAQWTAWAPPASLVVLALTWGRSLSALSAILVAITLGAAVLAAVHHAEVVALRVGEPFGSLTLAVAVTVIEVALIVALTLAGGDKAETLARDTVFAAVMITTNGIVGICLLIGARPRGGIVRFQSEGVSGALAALAALATLSLVLPVFTTSEPGPRYSSVQLAFAAVASLLLYGVYVFVQTVRHRDYFLPLDERGRVVPALDKHVEPPTQADALRSLGLLLACLVAVVGLAKSLSPTIENVVRDLGAPVTVVGIAVAGLVLLPETLAAARAARSERIQTSLNLAYGSALASIGLTIPTLAVASIWLPTPLTLGLGAKELILLALTMVVSTLTLVQGRATVMQATVHLSVFVGFVFLAIAP